MLFSGGSITHSLGDHTCGRTTFRVSNAYEREELLIDFGTWLHALILDDDGGAHVTFRAVKCGLHPHEIELFCERWARGAPLNRVRQLFEQHAWEIDLLFATSDANITHLLYARRRARAKAE